MQNSAFFNLGFRPFFLGAGVFAIVSMAMWMAIYTFGWDVPIQGMTRFQWHAHEMLYGYSLAVITGFLLTAIRNWTGMETLSGFRLMGLFLLWGVARVAMLFGTRYLLIAGVFDLLFASLLIAAISHPVIKAGSWKQLAEISKVTLLGIGNLLFYLGALGQLDAGLHLSIYGALYLIIGLIMTIGRRVIPFFIERGVGYPIKVFNSKWIDISNLTLFFAFFIFELFLPGKSIATYLAAALFIINLVRIVGWHTPGIWKKPLLWSLYISLILIDLGFLLFAFGTVSAISRILATHAFAVGGIGVMTLSMMARVSLGHTGRDIHDLPRGAVIALYAVLASAFSRVVLPLFDAQHYVLWIGLSQVFWILAFGTFVIVYVGILTSARVDGEFG